MNAKTISEITKGNNNKLVSIAFGGDFAKNTVKKLASVVREKEDLEWSIALGEVNAPDINRKLAEAEAKVNKLFYRWMEIAGMAHTICEAYDLIAKNRDFSLLYASKCLFEQTNTLHVYEQVIKSWVDYDAERAEANSVAA